MCQFINSPLVMPGWGCCQCFEYNGLQRQKCKVCRQQRHVFLIPKEVTQCPDCGWGWVGEMPTKNLVREFEGCPCCEAIRNESNRS